MIPLLTAPVHILFLLSVYSDSHQLPDLFRQLTFYRPELNLFFYTYGLIPAQVTQHFAGRCSPVNTAPFYYSHVFTRQLAAPTGTTCSIFGLVII